MVERTKKPYKKIKPTNNKDNENELTEEITAVLEEISAEPVKEKKKGVEVLVTDQTNILIGERHYHLVKNHRDAFDPERLGERFSDVLSRYDYIVGDWGYEQLRLKGFFYETNRKATPDQRIDTLEDYLYEYCNFGCAYFVMERVGGKREKQATRRKRTNKKQSNQVAKQAYVEEKRVPIHNKTKPVIKNRQDEKVVQKTNNKAKQESDTSKGRSFRIRHREEQS